MKIIFCFSTILILWHFLFYPLLLFIFHKEEKKNNKIDNLPSISLIIPLHNESKIINKKIENVFSLDYPLEKLEVILADDCSEDETLNKINSLKPDFLNKIKIISVKKRSGKVQVLNHAIKVANGDVVVFSDANSILKKDSLKNLIVCLFNNDVSLVCGRLIYINEYDSPTSFSESKYWHFENKLKIYESSFYSLTAINGSLYAIRKSDYIFINPMFSHDIGLPLFLILKGKKTKFCKEAVAYEKSGVNIRDEWKRKVRMFGRIYYFLFKNINLFFNPFLYNFKFFFSLISHRTIRYFLPLLHFLLFISSFILKNEGFFYSFIFYFHIIFLLLSIIGLICYKFKIFKFFYPFFYYLVFILSMIVGFINFITGRVKPYWEIVEGTR